jgi:hypothetical protein
MAPSKRDSWGAKLWIAKVRTTRTRSELLKVMREPFCHRRILKVPYVEVRNTHTTRLVGD